MMEIIRVNLRLFEFLGRCVFRRRLRGLLAVALVEAVYASGSVHKLLLARKERVALGADFHLQVILARGAGLKLVAAGAVYVDFVVFGMDSLFHFPRLPLYRRLSVLRSKQPIIKPAASKRQAGVLWPEYDAVAGSYFASTIY